MISDLEYSGPPPEWEPRCEDHGCQLVNGECPLCNDEARAEDHWDGLREDRRIAEPDDFTT